MDKSQLQCIACLTNTEHTQIFITNGIPVLRCGECGLGHADVKDFDADSYYGAAYFNGSHRDGYVDYEGSESILRAEFKESLAHLRSFGVDTGSLLEIGCAYGFFLEEARKYFQPYGIEIASAAVEACHARGLTNVKQGNATPELLDSVPQVDALVMLDVIEHLENPDQVLQFAAATLRPGGTVMITTGDFASLLAKSLGKNWRLMTPPQHLWFFTTESLRKIGASVGLELVSVQHPWKLVPLSLILYQLLRRFHLKFGFHEQLSSIGIPVNLFDAMRLIFRKTYPAVDPLN